MNKKVHLVLDQQNLKVNTSYWSTQSYLTFYTLVTCQSEEAQRVINFMVTEPYFNEMRGLPFWAVFYFGSFTESIVLSHFTFSITGPEYAIN